MRYKDNLKMSIIGLTTHKSRSLLTILGIVIGIMSITLVMAIGQSAQNLILGEVQGLGSNNVFIVPGKQPKGPMDGGASLLSDSLKTKDLQDMEKKSNVPNAVRVIPFVFGPVAASYGSDIYHTMALGSNELAFDAYNLRTKEGDLLTKEDIAQKSDAVIIGQKVVDHLFGMSDPVGQKIKIKNRNYRVAGVLEQKGTAAFMDFNDAILMPYTTVQEYILGIKHIQRIAVQADSPEDVANVAKDVTILLRNNHNITDPANDDFFVQTQADMMKTIKTLTDTLTILLSAVAAISLLVGGIGIMNIMLVSVTERTREIGLRKALGATNNNILTQFLTEAVILTMAGGVAGVFFGLSFSYLGLLITQKFAGLNFAFSVPVFGVVLGVSISIIIGLVFGIYPARQAARKSPIEALRYE